MSTDDEKPPRRFTAEELARCICPTGTFRDDCPTHGDPEILNGRVELVGAVPVFRELPKGWGCVSITMKLGVRTKPTLAQFNAAGRAAIKAAHDSLRCAGLDVEDVPDADLDRVVDLARRSGAPS